MILLITNKKSGLYLFIAKLHPILLPLAKPKFLLFDKIYLEGQYSIKCTKLLQYCYSVINIYLIKYT